MLVKSSNKRVATLPLTLKKRFTLVRTMWAGLGILKQADGTAEGLKEPFSRSLPCWGMHGGDYPGRLI